jgi:Raf kinase inhibitor-like YbhB/YbcL family protein
MLRAAAMTATGREALMADLTLRSPAFSDHDLMPERLSRQGGNVSPPLRWAGAPAGTSELVLLCEDPDAPSPEPFLHWLVTGVDPATDGTGEGDLVPSGREWPNGFGTTGWGGPQPPVGDGPHRYFFRLYAVSAPPELPARPTVSDVHRAVAALELASGTLVGRFAR